MSGGNQIMNILHIDDVIEGFKKLIELISQPKCNILQDEYVLTSSSKYKLRELAEIFTNITGKKLNINWGEREYREREVMIPWEKGTILPHWKDKVSLERGIMQVFK
jgi:nucleoside-diphosphate-sugar epimerase